MNLKINFSFFFLLLNFLIMGQDKRTLLTIEDESVTVSEFLKLYNKNLDLVKDSSQKEIDNYLQLFVDYKLKLQEAKQLGLDKEEKYIKELSNYRKQLTKNYLADSEVTDALVKEAYERSSYDVKASHILIMNSAVGEDTLRAYNKLMDYRKVLDEQDFDVARQKFHNGKTIVVEDLGYFSAFKMVYDFETAAYNTTPGTVSMPFKTDFGYHVVKVYDKRPSRGTATAAHIMVASKQNDSTINPETRINEIYQKLQQGESFEALAKQFSDDKSSARNGGKLKPFKSGQLSSTVFEDATFGIKKVGAYTKPIQTEFGWHIIKLLELQPAQDFETLEPSLKVRVKRDSRSKLINSTMAKKLFETYDVKLNPNTRTYFKNAISDDYFSGKFELPVGYKGNDPVITINGQAFNNNEFVQFLKSKQRRYMANKISVNALIDKELKAFYDQSLLNYREQNLENENQEFADILKEYKDGLLLFDLMEKEIWNKASIDTLGLQSFYNKNASSYNWEDRVDVTFATSKSKKDLQKVKAMLNDDKTVEGIKEAFGKENKNSVLFTNGIFELTSTKLPKNLEAKKGVSDIYEHNESYHVFHIKEVLPSAPKTFKEAQGKVTSDYQNFIEENWVSALRKKYKVSVDEKILEELKEKIKTKK